jgi:hypothetical protein
MVSETLIMDNPKNKRVLIRRMFASLIVFAVVTLYAIVRVDGRWSLPIVLMMAIIILLSSSFPFFTAWRNEYLLRPYRVEIKEDGLLLHKNYHKVPKFVPWEEILSFYAPPGDPEKQIKHYSQDGAFYTRNQSTGKMQATLVHWSIAIAGRERYFEKMGRFPPLMLTEVPEDSHW